VSFEVSADAYDRFMGRFSIPLAMDFVGLVGLSLHDRVLDVGCGPGALTAELASRLPADSISAVDPSAPFVEAVRSRFPHLDVRLAGAETLPFDDGTFDLTLAQLVVHFLPDPVTGLVEMVRVTRSGGRVAASVWDHAGGGGPLGVFWAAVRDLGSGARDESGLPGAREGHLAELFGLAGLQHVTSSVLTVRLAFETFDDWWQPFTLGVGPAGAHVAGLDESARRELRDRCAELLPSPPFEVAASAWTAIGTVPAGD
jgi:SAM-dependent methyltransferase